MSNALRGADAMFRYKYFRNRIVLLILLMILFCFSACGSEEKPLEQIKKESIESLSIELKNSASKKNSPFLEAYDVIEGVGTGEVLLDPDGFQKTASNKSAYYTGTARITCNVNFETKKSDIVVLQFTAYTLEGNLEINVKMDDTEYAVTLSKTPRAFYIPFSDIESIETLGFSVTSEFVPMVIDSVYLINYHDCDVSGLATGIYTLDDHQVVRVSSESQIIEGGNQLLIDDSYIYTIYGDQLYAYQKNGNEYIVIDTCGSVGTARDMAFSKDKKAIFVTSREYGMYIIDVSVPSEMRMVSHYDTLEYATGIDVNGDYCFVCSRYCGVEVVDVSDLQHPKFVNAIGSQREYQDCVVDDGLLYIGVYENKCVDIWDVHDLNDPAFVSTIELDGQGQGITIRNGILFVATGLLNADGKISDPYWEFNKGTGNGFEIYDVSSPSNPVRLSMCKIDGRYWYNAVDIWDISVSDDYAYVAGMYNGVWVYDISDLKNPICKNAYNLVLEEGERIDTATYILSYDQNKELREYARHVACAQGGFYVATNHGIYYLDDQNLKKGQTEPQTVNFTRSKQDVQIPELSDYKVERYCNNESIWSVTVGREYIYVAAGEAGIVVLNKSLEQLRVIECQNSVRDLKVFNNVLYAAESEGGVTAYEINGDDLVLLGRFSVRPSYRCLTQLGITNDGCYVLAKCGMRAYIVLDVSDPTQMLELHFDAQSKVGLSYHRTICDRSLTNGWLGICGHDQIQWYNVQNGELKNVKNWKCQGISGIGIERGISAWKDSVLIMAPTGYYRIEPLNADEVTFIKVPGAEMMKGKSASSDRTLVSVDCRGGNVTIVNIEDIEQPELVEQFIIDGNPDIPYISDEMILIPCRYYGLLKLSPY